MLRCPECKTALPKQSAAVTFTANRRVDRYWCDTCRCFQRATVQRDFNAEDAGQDYTAPILWDLGALPPSHPFAAVRDEAA